MSRELQQQHSPVGALVATPEGVREEAATAAQPCEALVATPEGVREEMKTAEKNWRALVATMKGVCDGRTGLNRAQPCGALVATPEGVREEEAATAAQPCGALVATPEGVREEAATAAQPFGGATDSIHHSHFTDNSPLYHALSTPSPLHHAISTPSTPKASEQKPAGRCEEYGGPSHPLPTPSTPKTSEQKPAGRCEEVSSLSPPPSAARLLCFSDPGDGLCAPRDSMHGHTLSEVTDPPKEERSMLSSGGQAVRTEDTDAPKEQRSMLSSGGQSVRTEDTDAPKEERPMLSSGGQAVRTEDTDQQKEERSMLSSGAQAMPSGYGKDASATESIPRGRATDSLSVGIFWNEAFYMGMMAVGVEPVTTPGTGSPLHPNSNLVFFKEFDDDHGHCPVACAVAAACSTCAKSWAGR
eukprot:gene2529-5479_t